MKFDHAELTDIAAILPQPLRRPRRHDAAQIARGDAVLVEENLAILVGVEQAQRRFPHRRSFDRIERHFLDKAFERLGKR